MTSAILAGGYCDTSWTLSRIGNGYKYHWSARCPLISLGSLDSGFVRITFLRSPATAVGITLSKLEVDDIWVIFAPGKNAVFLECAQSPIWECWGKRRLIWYAIEFMYSQVLHSTVRLLCHCQRSSSPSILSLSATCIPTLQCTAMYSSWLQFEQFMWWQESLYWQKQFFPFCDFLSFTSSDLCLKKMRTFWWNINICRSLYTEYNYHLIQVEILFLTYSINNLFAKI